MTVSVVKSAGTSRFIASIGGAHAEGASAAVAAPVCARWWAAYDALASVTSPLQG
jgi:hypothetical protein